MIQNVAKINVRKVTLAQRKPDEELRECCGEPWLVLANRADLSNQEQNDVTLVFERCDTLNVYVRYNGGAEQAAAGIPITFPNDSEIKGFLIDWKQYANIGGQLIQGSYDVYVETIYFGFTQKFFYNSYRLLEFNRMNTEGTIRIASRFNDYSDLYDVDFSGSGAMDMVRLRGFFGFRQPNYETKNNTEISKKRKKVFNKSNNTYSLIIEPTLECKTQRVEQLHLLHASELFISDYNKYNHYKEIIEIPVILSDEDSPEFDYFEGIGTKYAKVLATFKDRISKRKSKNTGTGENVPIPDVSLNTGLVCPTPTPCADATFEINGIEVATIPAGDTGSIQVLQGGLEVGELIAGNWVIPECEVCEDGTVTVNRDGVFFADVPVASGGTATINVMSQANKLPTKSGQTVSYATGDDGDDQRAREVSFFILTNNNPFGHNKRFTGTNGGYHDGVDFRDKDGVVTTKALAFPNDIMLDWAYVNGDNLSGQVMMWYTLDFGNITPVSDREWGNMLNNINNLSQGGFSNWKMPNILEFSTILWKNDPNNLFLNYQPFDGNGGRFYWTSETVNLTPANAYRIQTLTANYLAQSLKNGQTTATRLIAVRYSNYTTTGGNVVIS
jgi:hypothetical protein